MSRTREEIDAEVSGILSSFDADADIETVAAKLSLIQGELMEDIQQNLGPIPLETEGGDPIQTEDGETIDLEEA